MGTSVDKPTCEPPEAGQTGDRLRVTHSVGLNTPIKITPSDLCFKDRGMTEVPIERYHDQGLWIRKHSQLAAGRTS